MMPSLCNLPGHVYQPIHRVNGMACLKVGCGGAWRDCVGEFGAQYRAGCPRCGGVYWLSTRIDQQVQSRA